MFLLRTVHGDFAKLTETTSGWLDALSAHHDDKTLKSVSKLQAQLGETWKSLSAASHSATTAAGKGGAALLQARG